MTQTHFVAKALVIDKNDHFLLLTRSQTHPHLAGLYDLPGGVVEEHEEPGHAIIREIHEESGIVIDPLALKVIYATTMVISGNSWPTLLYLIRLDEAEPQVTLSYEHSAYEWAKLDRLQEVEPHIAPTYREALEYILSNNIIAGIKLG